VAIHKPTDAQLRILNRIDKGLSPYTREGGRVMSGTTRVREKLQELGLITRHNSLTQAGRESLAFALTLSDRKPRVGPKPKPGTCRECGCTEFAACPGGCAWADGTMTICTQCAGVEP
jgi:hypothetical protein